MSKEIINSSELQAFLEDFEKNSITEILEEGSKEYNEILEIASARGIILKNRQSLAGVKMIYTFAEKANLNKARLPEKELLRALPTLVGTPLDINHERQYVVGHFIDYRWIVKDKSVIAYAIVYKGNFADEWETAKKLFKAGKLTTSYEILSPKNKRVTLADGTFELHDMEIAGGALLFKEKPAFPDAKVLEIAKQNIAKESENLVYALKYRCEDLIINGETKCQNCGKCKHIEVAEAVVGDVPKVAEVKVEEKPVAPVIPAPIVIPKIKCANCQHEFDAPKVATSEIKCSECFAIINEKGDLLYPPQIIDFNISCPSCASRNWRLLKKDEATGQIKCLSCAKKYSIVFETVTANAVLNMIQFVHVGHVSCKQCGNYIEYSGTSQVTTYNLKCKKCGLAFEHDITKEAIKRLSKIEEITDPIKASEEIPSKADELKIDTSAIKEEAKGESQIMEQKQVENIVEVTVASTPDAKSEVAEVKVVLAETVAPVVASEEAPKVEETPKPEEAKVEETKPETVATVVEEVKIEAKIETPIEAKVEETPKVEPIVEAKVEETPKVEEPKAEVAPIVEAPKVEVAKEETKEEKKTKKHKEWIRKMKLMKKEKASIIKTLEEKVEFYKANAEEISKRRRELGEAGNALSDIEILDNAKFSDTKLVQANLETSSVVGTKKTDEDTYKKYRDEIDAKAQGKIKRAK